MFPEKMRRGQEGIVAQGWPTLVEAMEAGGITTPAQQAAVLTIAAYEANGEFNRREDGDTRQFGGRGYVQLTLEENYRAAGKTLSVDLVANPEWARNLLWSAKILVWYVTKARPLTLSYAEQHRMGMVNKMIGYPLGDGAEDRRRCAAFGRAYEYITGEKLTDIDCSR
jgi:putative chitinase